MHEETAPNIRCTQQNYHNKPIISELGELCGTTEVG